VNPISGRLDSTDGVRELTPSYALNKDQFSFSPPNLQSSRGQREPVDLSHQIRVTDCKIHCSRPSFYPHAHDSIVYERM
jgi:hypothetical protein